jgi:hypothetical protein
VSHVIGVHEEMAPTMWRSAEVVVWMARLVERAGTEGTFAVWPESCRFWWVVGGLGL